MHDRDQPAMNDLQRTIFGRILYMNYLRIGKHANDWILPLNWKQQTIAKHHQQIKKKKGIPCPPPCTQSRVTCNAAVAANA